LFFVVNGQLILLTVHTFSAAGRFHPDFIARIQTALDTLGPGGQTYETVDLSGFTNFAS
jgi:hypothetical protein